jgi:putative hydrolase of the HAD superfamily
LSDRAIDTVLFDFGGTLFMPAPAERLVRAVVPQLDAREQERLAVAFTEAGIPGATVPPIPPELQDLYDARDLGPEQHRRAWVAMLSRADPALAEAMYEQTLDPQQWVPYPDAASTLSALAERDVRIGLISNIGFDLREVLYGHGFGALADTATLSYEVGVMKPDPKIFRAALDNLGARAQSTLMVGDSEVADGGAEELGIATLILEMTPAGSVHGLNQVVDRVDTRR